ncbi:MAG: lactonase family protein [Cellulomonas sp.]|uniref:lactonase family protein n=1 Tax=Cellulomonas sp. TaxID=40001 RepID=UPI0017DA346F|nr:beta-propeller fold lactonase family protein [Cellulomonas sp.]NMM29951.1 lactonase family protein [Cellulomonas sp.]
MTSARTSLWVGTYPAAGAGSPAGLGEGIWRVELDAGSGTFGGAELVAVTPSPSFVAAHPSGRVLYAVGELTAGTVTAFSEPSRTSVDPAPHDPAPGPLAVLDVVDSGGADPCHLLLAPDARTLYVANYSSGTLGVLPLDADGRFTVEVRAQSGPVQVFGHAGSGPDASRQDGPHAHFVAIAPGGQFVVVADLGTDELRRYARDTASGLLAAAGIAATLPPGTGPRHLVFAPDGRTAYVVGELDVCVHVLAWDPVTASGTLVQSLPAGPPPGPLGQVPGGPASHRVLPSHVELDDDRLLVAVRTSDVLVGYSVVADGTLVADGATALPGAWPRHFALVDGTVVVAAQVGDVLVALRPGEGTVPWVVASVLPLPAPACVVPAA